MGEAPGIIYPGKKFLICGLVKLENKAFTPKIQWWDRNRITVTDILTQEGRIWGAGGRSFWSNFKIQLQKQD